MDRVDSFSDFDIDELINEAQDGNERNSMQDADSNEPSFSVKEEDKRDLNPEVQRIEQDGDEQIPDFLSSLSSFSEVSRSNGSLSRRRRLPPKTENVSGSLASVFSTSASDVDGFNGFMTHFRLLIVLDFESKLPFLKPNDDYVPSFVKEARIGRSAQAPIESSDASFAVSVPSSESAHNQDINGDDNAESDSDESDSSNPISYDASNITRSVASAEEEDEKEEEDVEFLSTRLSRISEREEPAESRKIMESIPPTISEDQEADSRNLQLIAELEDRCKGLQTLVENVYSIPLTDICSSSLTFASYKGRQPNTRE